MKIVFLFYQSGNNTARDRTTTVKEGKSSVVPQPSNVDKPKQSNSTHEKSFSSSTIGDSEKCSTNRKGNINLSPKSHAASIKHSSSVEEFAGSSHSPILSKSSRGGGWGASSTSDSNNKQPAATSSRILNEINSVDDSVLSQSISFCAGNKDPENFSFKIKGKDSTKLLEKIKSFRIDQACSNLKISESLNKNELKSSATSNITCNNNSLIPQEHSVKKPSIINLDCSPIKKDTKTRMIDLFGDDDDKGVITNTHSKYVKNITRPSLTNTGILFESDYSGSSTSSSIKTQNEGIHSKKLVEQNRHSLLDVTTKSDSSSNSSRTSRWDQQPSTINLLPLSISKCESYSQNFDSSPRSSILSNSLNNLISQDQDTSIGNTKLQSSREKLQKMFGIKAKPSDKMPIATSSKIVLPKELTNLLKSCGSSKEAPAGSILKNSLTDLMANESCSGFDLQSFMKRSNKDTPSTKANITTLESTTATLSSAFHSTYEHSNFKSSNNDRRLLASTSSASSNVLPSCFDDHHKPSTSKSSNRIPYAVTKEIQLNNSTEFYHDHSPGYTIEDTPVSPEPDDLGTFDSPITDSSIKTIPTEKVACNKQHNRTPADNNLNLGSIAGDQAKGPHNSRKGSLSSHSFRFDDFVGPTHDLSRTTIDLQNIPKPAPLPTALSGSDIESSPLKKSGSIDVHSNSDIICHAFESRNASPPSADSWKSKSVGDGKSLQRQDSYNQSNVRSNKIGGKSQTGSLNIEEYRKRRALRASKPVTDSSTFLTETSRSSAIPNRGSPHLDNVATNIGKEDLSRVQSVSTPHIPNPYTRQTSAADPRLLTTPSADRVPRCYDGQQQIPVVRSLPSPLQPNHHQSPYNFSHPSIPYSNYPTRHVQPNNAYLSRDPRSISNQFCRDPRNLATQKTGAPIDYHNSHMSFNRLSSPTNFSGAYRSQLGIGYPGMYNSDVPYPPPTSPTPPVVPPDTLEPVSATAKAIATSFTCIIMKGLPHFANSQHIYKFFQDYILKAICIELDHGLNCTGTAYIQFPNHEFAADCLNKMNGYMMQGYQITLSAIGFGFFKNGQNSYVQRNHERERRLGIPPLPSGNCNPFYDPKRIEKRKAAEAMVHREMESKISNTLASTVGNLINKSVENEELIETPDNKYKSHSVDEQSVVSKTEALKIKKNRRFRRAVIASDSEYSASDDEKGNFSSSATKDLGKSEQIAIKHADINSGIKTSAADSPLTDLEPESAIANEFNFPDEEQSQVETMEVEPASEKEDLLDFEDIQDDFLQSDPEENIQSDEGLTDQTRSIQNKDDDSLKSTDDSICLGKQISNLPKRKKKNRDNLSYLLKMTRQTQGVVKKVLDDEKKFKVSIPIPKKMIISLFNEKSLQCRSKKSNACQKEHCLTKTNDSSNLSLSTNKVPKSEGLNTKLHVGNLTGKSDGSDEEKLIIDSEISEAHNTSTLISDDENGIKGSEQGVNSQFNESSAKNRVDVMVQASANCLNSTKQTTSSNDKVGKSTVVMMADSTMSDDEPMVIKDASKERQINNGNNNSAFQLNKSNSEQIVDSSQGSTDELEIVEVSTSKCSKIVGTATSTTVSAPSTTVADSNVKSTSVAFVPGIGQRDNQIQENTEIIDLDDDRLHIQSQLNVMGAPLDTDNVKSTSSLGPDMQHDLQTAAQKLAVSSGGVQDFDDIVDLSDGSSFEKPSEVPKNASMLHSKLLGTTVDPIILDSDSEEDSSTTHNTEDVNLLKRPHENTEMNGSLSCKKTKLDDNLCASVSQSECTFQIESVTSLLAEGVERVTPTTTLSDNAEHEANTVNRVGNEIFNLGAVQNFSAAAVSNSNAPEQQVVSTDNFSSNTLVPDDDLPGVDLLIPNMGDDDALMNNLPDISTLTSITDPRILDDNVPARPMHVLHLATQQSSMQQLVDQVDLTLPSCKEQELKKIQSIPVLKPAKFKSGVKNIKAVFNEKDDSENDDNMQDDFETQVEHSDNESRGKDVNNLSDSIDHPSKSLKLISNEVQQVSMEPTPGDLGQPVEEFTQSIEKLNPIPTISPLKLYELRQFRKLAYDPDEIVNDNDHQQENNDPHHEQVPIVFKSDEENSTPIRKKRGSRSTRGVRKRSNNRTRDKTDAVPPVVELRTLRSRFTKDRLSVHDAALNKNIDDSISSKVNLNLSLESSFNKSKEMPSNVSINEMHHSSALESDNDDSVSVGFASVSSFPDDVSMISGESRELKTPDSYSKRRRQKVSAGTTVERRRVTRGSIVEKSEVNELVHWDDGGVVDLFQCELCQYAGRQHVNHLINYHSDREITCMFKKEDVSSIFRDKVGPFVIEADETPEEIDLTWVPDGLHFDVEVTCIYKGCGYNSRIRFDLLYHYLVHYPRAIPTIYHCRLCQHMSNDIIVSYDHFTSHTGEYRYKCNNCGFRSYSEKRLHEHYSSHHKDMDTDFSCAEPIMEDQWPYTHICKSCLFTQIDKVKLENHTTIKHNGKSEIVKVNMFRSIAIHAEKFKSKTNFRKSKITKKSKNFDKVFIGDESQNERDVLEDEKEAKELMDRISQNMYTTRTAGDIKHKLSLLESWSEKLQRSSLDDEEPDMAMSEMDALKSNTDDAASIVGKDEHSQAEVDAAEAHISLEAPSQSADNCTIASCESVESLIKFKDSISSNNRHIENEKSGDEYSSDDGELHIDEGATSDINKEESASEDDDDFNDTIPYDMGSVSDLATDVDNPSNEDDNEKLDLGSIIHRLALTLHKNNGLKTDNNEDNDSDSEETSAENESNNEQEDEDDHSEHEVDESAKVPQVCFCI